MKKAIVLVQMGGPLNEQEMKNFLWRMFNDRHILPFAKLFRLALAGIITSARYKKSWAKYELIGGTPIIAHTHAMANQLKKRLENKVEVKAAFSYSQPDISCILGQLQKQGIEEFFIIPLYPHYSITTFQAVVDETEYLASKMDLRVQFAPPFSEEKSFIRNWANLIQSEMQKKKVQNPHLLFSGHSIPLSFIKKGDTYSQEIANSAQLIASKLGLEYSVSYQSQIKGQKWLGPQTDETLQHLRKKGVENVVLIPISFVNENLETLYDMDKILLSFGKQELGFKNVLRPKLPAYTDLFLEQLQFLSADFI